MSESTKAIASLKKAGNYMKLAMRKNGPRSFKRGQGALIKGSSTRPGRVRFPGRRQEGARLEGTRRAIRREEGRR